MNYENVSKYEILARKVIKVCGDTGLGEAGRPTLDRREVVEAILRRVIEPLVQAIRGSIRQACCENEADEAAYAAAKAALAAWENDVPS